MPRCTPSGPGPFEYEADGEPLCVCRVWMHGGVHPAKVRPAFGTANIGYGNEEHPVLSYEVLLHPSSPAPRPVRRADGTHLRRSRRRTVAHRERDDPRRRAVLSRRRPRAGTAGEVTGRAGAAGGTAAGTCSSW
ncbi:DM9 repeat-containing protein [Actinoplanes sandaracinus]|uniref:DM9 repeat-containing protein n=1 Tax=Actinoplanes sandaracinus TaxID=3045177 RepID=UPI003898FD28